MAMHTGVTSARAVCKPSSSPSLSRSSSANRLVRRRGRGSLVRSRAFIWSKEDLQKLHDLAKRPRHEVTPDVVDHHILTKSPYETPSPDNSACTDLDDMEENHHQTTFAAAVDQQLMEDTLYHSPLHSLKDPDTRSLQPQNPFTVTMSKPPLHRMYQPTHALPMRSNKLQLSVHSRHSMTPEPSSTNQSNLAAVSGIASRLIDLTL